MNDITGKWCYSINEENYYGQYDTEEEAHGDAEIALDEDEREPGPSSYWIAQCCNPLDHIPADRLGDYIEQTVGEWADDECSADDYILTMTKDDKEKIGQLVIEFIREHASIHYWSVKNIKEHSFVIREVKNDNTE